MEEDISSIEDDFGFQKKEWVIERIFWVLMALFLTLGLLGTFGDSEALLNHKTTQINGAVVQYDRFSRVEKRFMLRVSFPEKSDNCTIGFNDDYVQQIQITQVIPEPEKVSLENGKVIYHFDCRYRGTVTFFKDPLKMGKQKLLLNINGKEKQLTQYIYF